MAAMPSAGILSQVPKTFAQPVTRNPAAGFARLRRKHPDRHFWDRLAVPLRIILAYFMKMLELEFHGTHYPDFRYDQFPGQSIDLAALPVHDGLKLNFMPDKGVNPFVGAGATYYFLSTSPGRVHDQSGVYFDAGLDIGGKGSTRFFAELMWRKVDTSLIFGAFDRDVRFGGLGLNAGATWRWGN